MMQDKLATVFDKYGSPDPKYIERLPKGGTTLDFIGHARITQWLLEIDPMWTIEPVAFDDAGLPARTKHGTMVQAGFWMTVCGHRRYCVGSVEERKTDIGKELVSDAIRNGAMRFGLALDLWSKLPLGEEPESAPGNKTAAHSPSEAAERPSEPRNTQRRTAAPDGDKRRQAPTDKMIAYARSLADRKQIALSKADLDSFDACKAFIDAHKDG